MIHSVRRTQLLPLLLAALLAACAPAATAPTSSVPEPQSPSASASVAAYPVTLTDDAGASVLIESEPQRIISLAPSNTEIVCALGACDRVVGVTDADDFPAEVTDIPDVVVAAQVDTEAVVAAEPDLVLAAGNELTPTTVIAQLTDLGLTVMTLYPETLDEVYADIELVGSALGTTSAAADVVADMEDRAAAVQEAVVGTDVPRTFYEVGVFEGTIYTAGEGSFLADLIESAGGDPITGDATGTIGLEDLVAADPQLIVLGDATYDPSITADAVAQRPGWGEMAAVRDGRILVFTDDLIATRPGPRIVDGLEALAHVIHPEAFD